MTRDAGAGGWNRGTLRRSEGIENGNAGSGHRVRAVLAAAILASSVALAGVLGASTAVGTPAPGGDGVLVPAVADAGGDRDHGGNGTLSLNATRLRPNGTVRFTVTATDGPVRFTNSDTHDVQRRIGGEWRDLYPNRGGATVIVTMEQGESRSWTWSPDSVRARERTGRYRVVFSTVSSDLAAEFRVVDTTLAPRPDAAVVTPGGTTTIPVVLAAAPDGLSAFDVTASVTNATTASVVGASLADRFEGTATVADGSASLNASDANDSVPAGATDVRLGTVTVRGDAAGGAALSLAVGRLTDDGGEPVDTYARTGTLTVFGEGTTLGLAPRDRMLAPGETASYDVVLVDPPAGGVGSYVLDVSVADPGTVSITDATTGIGGNGRVEIDDGSSVRIGPVAGGAPDAATTIATVTVAGERRGVTSLTLDPVPISGASGDPDASGSPAGATVRVATQPVPDVTGNGAPATDPDGDGVYEDVTGDGEVTPGDAGVLFDAAFEGDVVVARNAAAFDLTGDGEITPGDAGLLFEEASGA